MYKKGIHQTAPNTGADLSFSKEQQEEERCLQRKQQLPSITMTHHNHENQKWHPAEELNGRLAMIGIVAALLNYAWTGQIIPGIW